MGNKLLDFWSNGIKKEHKIAFIVTFSLVLLIHMYMFVNNLQSEDAIYYYYHTQNMTTSGRWALSFFCSFSSYFHLSWITGLLAATFISLTVVVITEIFKIKNPITIGLIGGLFASANFIADIGKYIYTIDGYMISMFLATLAVYFTRIEEKRISRYVLGAILLCLSCGIYQSFVPFAVVLVICEVLQHLIENKIRICDLIRWLIKQVIMFVIALIAYYIIWKICLYFCNINAHEYLGISNVGRINFDMIINGFTELPLIVEKFFFRIPNVTHLSPFFVLNVIFIIMFFIAIIGAVFKNKLYKEPGKLTLYILCILLIVPCSCFWIFTSSSFDAWIYWPRMLGGLFLVYILTLIIYEKYFGKILKNIFMFLAIAIIFNNTVMVNIMYSYIEKAYEYSYAEGLEMVVRLREVVDEYEEKNPNTEISTVVFVGNRASEVAYELYDFEKNEPTIMTNSYNYLGNLKESVLWDGVHAFLFIDNYFDLGLDDPEVWNSNYRDSFLDKEEVKVMDIWPGKNSVAIVDNVAVVKLSNTKEADA